VVRRLVASIRDAVLDADPCPLPALEMLIIEMLAIHYCSDYDEACRVLEGLLAEVRSRVDGGQGVMAAGAVRIYWVNPVADLRVMNLVEDLGGRICGADFMVSHAIDPLDEALPPLEALARAALADPMVGTSTSRGERVCREAVRRRAEAVVISRIPGASHCASEGAIIGEQVRSRLGLPVAEIEVASLTDSMEPTLRTRLQALVETVRGGRRS
jgi:hypothetical protein